MTIALVLVLLAAVVHFSGGVASFAVRAHEERATLVSAGSGLCASLLGLAGAVSVLLHATHVGLNWATPASFAPLSLRLDALGALVVVAVCLLSAATSLYALDYVREYREHGIGRLGLRTGCFLGSMLLCLIADDALTFLVCLEALSVSACLLILFERDRSAADAGLWFLGISLGGSILIAIAFLLLLGKTGSLAFESFRTASLPGSLASVVFLLALLGFAAKSGVMPLHGWLPREAGAAPAHISALMSGAMVKVGVFGIIRVSVDLLHAAATWWGLAVLGLGAASAVLGAMYALAERDLKRLLAYSTVENIGIIWIGVGIGIVGIASGRPLVGSLGLLAGLYHLLNHAMFKGLLFLGAGSVVSRVGTRDLDRMGGLSRTMPWTAAAFLIGTASISALPPLNGFVSEWFTYQALFQAALDGGFVDRLLAPLAMVALALAGALALMAFVKAFGMGFLGMSRSVRAGEATDVDPPMRWGMTVPAVVCLLLGLGAPLVAVPLRDVATSLVRYAPAIADGVTVLAGEPEPAVVSPALIGVLLASFLAVPVALAAYYAAERPPRRIAKEIWATGYAPDASMNVSATGFAEPIRVMFRPAFVLRSWGSAGTARSLAPGARPGGAAPLAGPGVETPEAAAPAAAERGSRFSALALVASGSLVLLFAAISLVLAMTGGR